MRFLVVIILCFILCLPAYASKDYAKRYPNDNAMEVYTPNNPPPSNPPGGSSPQLQYNNSGSFGGVTGSGVDSNGNIGIGTITPTSILSLNAADQNGIDLNTYSSAGTTVSASYVLIAGGGGGCGGGGGAGGYLSGTASLNYGQSYAVVIGGGGTGCPNVNVGGATNGSDSTALSLTAIGGGRGGDATGTAPGKNGGNGGSGGGGGENSGAVTGGTGTVGQGNNGGTNGGFIADPFPAGGGGGASSSGSNATGASTAGNGGAGTSSSITGSSVCRAGGGGGSLFHAGTDGTATCGGGNGHNNAAGGNGTDNTGGGGGGTGETSGDKVGGNGGSGVFIVSYPSTGVTDGTGGTITHSGGKTIHTFTSSGTFIAPTASNTAQSRIRLKTDGLLKYTISADQNYFRISGGAAGTNDYFTINGANTGIGTISPNDTLSVGGNAAVGSAYSTISAPANGLLVQGNVGIGSAAPGSALSVQGDAYIGGRVYFGSHSGVAQLSNWTTNVTDQAGTGENTSGTLSSNNGSFSWQMNVLGYTGAFYNQSTNSIANGLIAKINGTGAQHVFTANSGSGGGTDLFTVLGSGNVGIGSVTPGALLDVAGLARTRALAPQEETFASSTSITPTGLYKLCYMANTQGAGAFTVNNPTNNGAEGQTLILKISSTAIQTFSWGTAYNGGSYGLPSQTLGTSTIEYFPFIWDAVNSHWDYQGGGGNGFN